MSNDPRLSLPGLPTSAPCTQLNLILKAERLKRKDLLTKSDPVCIVYMLQGRIHGKKSSGRPEWREIGRTERIRNTSEPEWATQIQVDYYFEEKQTLQLDVYDWDTEALNTPLNEHDFLGRMTCDLAEVVSSGTFTRALGENGRNGSITITSEEVDDGCRETLVMDMSAEKLDKKDWGLFAKSDPYLKIYRYNDNGSKVMIHRTEFIKKTLNPTWKTFELNVKTLCGGDKTKKILIECWDNDDDSLSDHDFIGSCEIPVEEIISNSALSKPLRNEKKAAKSKKYMNSGTLILKTKMIVLPTFLDFIAGGTQLDFSVAVDFTASNGAVHKPSSLHFCSEAKPNQYEIAIKAVLEICQHYNNSKIFDAYGFGAKLNNSKMIPIFAMNDPKPTMCNPAVVGVEGVLRSYRHCLNNVHLFGPTNFAPIINQTMKATVTKIKKEGSRYQILLIITDGEICDMEQTKKAIIEATGLPISIIIVGVGNEAFEKMDELDGDTNRLSSGGRVAERDIVQFVPIRKFSSGNGEHISDMVMAKLAKEVLAEVPLQLTSYMRKHNIMPRPADDPWPRDACAIPQYEPPFIAPTGPPAHTYQYPPPGNGYKPAPTGPPPAGFRPGYEPYPSQASYAPPPPPYSGGGQHYSVQAPYPPQLPYPPQGPSQPAPYPPGSFNVPSHVTPYSSSSGAQPYPPHPDFHEPSNGRAFPYGAYTPENVTNQQSSSYNYPTYPQPKQNEQPNPSPSQYAPDASAPPVSVEDLQLSFSNAQIEVESEDSARHPSNPKVYNKY